MDDNGRWVTLDNGQHIFIEDGKSFEEALDDAFENADVIDEVDKKLYKAISDKDYEKIGIIINDIKEPYFKKSLHKLFNEKGLKFKLDESEKNCYFDGENTIIMNETGLKADGFLLDGETFTHEVAHAIDNLITGKGQLSYKYVSKKYNKKIYEMLNEELSFCKSKIGVKGLLERIDSDINNYATSHSYEDSEKYWYRAYGDLLDMVQSVYETHNEDTIRNLLISGHDAYYFRDNYKKQAAELFAEITSARLINKYSYETLKKLIPKTIEIYEEIIKEL